MDDLSNDKRENVPQGARFYELDVGSSCAEVFEEFQPRSCATMRPRRTCVARFGSWDLDADGNVIGTVRPLGNCVEHGARRVLFTSTGGATAASSRPFRPPGIIHDIRLLPMGSLP